MYNKTQPPEPKDISYDRVKSYMQWLIERYGDYSAKALLNKANSFFRLDAQYNEAALDYLKERGIVDDLRYAKRLTLSLTEKNIGPNKIKEKLYTKGFTSHTIDECIFELDISDEDYFAKALILKIRKFGEEPIGDIKVKQKALRHLMSKGFSYSIANEVVNYSGSNEEYLQ
ncbi:MAG: RecX family transcriptional regulator [Colwellia sp.]|nr:RecX family transcriptional regulator [Colwellia sp.]